MQINVTFIIQIINFGISYVVLRKFLFLPFMQLIKQKQTAQQTLDAIIGHKDYQAQQLSQQRADQLITFQAHIGKNYQRPIAQLTAQPQFEERPVDQTLVRSLTKEVSAFVIKKAIHDQ